MKEKPLILLLILPLIYSCSFNQPVPYTNAKILTSDKLIQNGFPVALNSYTNEEGKGLVLFNDNIFNLENFKPAENSKKNIGKNIGYSSISLNNHGNGFIVWLDNKSYRESLINQLHVAKITDFKYTSEKIYNSSDNYTYPPVVKIDEKGNGFISWDTEKENKFIVITNFNLSENIKNEKVDYKYFLSHIESNDTSKIYHIDLSSIKLKYPTIKLVSDKYVDSISGSKEKDKSYILATLEKEKINFPVPEIRIERSEKTAENKLSFLRLNSHIEKDTLDKKSIGVFCFVNFKNFLYTSTVYSNSNLKNSSKRITSSLLDGDFVNGNININKQGSGVLFWVEQRKDNTSLRYSSIKNYLSMPAFDYDPSLNQGLNDQDVSAF